VKVQKVEMLFRYCTFAIWELFGTNIHISVKNRKKTPSKHSATEPGGAQTSQREVKKQQHLFVMDQKQHWETTSNGLKSIS